MRRHEAVRVTEPQKSVVEDVARQSGLSVQGDATADYNQRQSLPLANADDARTSTKLMRFRMRLETAALSNRR
jgi:hypothetical protein